MAYQIPGKSCDSCMMCCQVLDIPELQKPPGPDCPNCVKGGGCAIYMTRPKVCREFECEWLRERALGPRLRPDRVGAVLIECPDSDEYRAVCHPDRPFDWQDPHLMKHLIAKAKSGRVVVAKSCLKSWRIYPSGRYAATV